MKAIFLLLLSTLPALCQPFTMSDQAFMSAAALGQGAAPPAACSTYSTTNAWDNFIEGFQSASPPSYESNVWTSVGTVANITTNADSSALTTGKPAGACSQAWKVVLPTDGTETYSYATVSAIDLDTVQTDVTFSFYVEAGPDAGDGFSIMSYRASSTPSATTGVALRNAGGQLSVFARGATNSAAINISEGQWYTAMLSFDTAQAPNGSTFKVFSLGEQVGSATFQRTAGIDIRRVFIGPCYDLDSVEAGTVWIDLVCIKTN